MVEKKKGKYIVQYRKISPAKNPTSQGIARFSHWEFRFPQVHQDWRRLRSWETLKELDSM